MNRRQRAQYAVLSLIGLLFVAYYLGWWFKPDRLTNTVGAPFGILLLGALTFVTLHRPFIELYGWVILRKVRDNRPSEPPEGLKVAIVTTFVPGSEPFEMLETTLRAMVAADYPHDTWVLDEGDGDDVKALCAELGVQHYSRKGIAKYNTDSGTFMAKTKGGNHNAWYDWCFERGIVYDIVSQFDTDFEVERDVLTSVLGYFNDPAIAYVGTPQIYGNTGSWIARGAAEQTFMFYGPVMKGLGDRGQGLLIGANHTVRVSALRNIGLYFAHLAEDLATGMTFGSKGWKGVYTTKVLATGEGPTTWSAYFTQQYRWAFGCLHLLFRHTPRLIRTMPFKQGLRYLWMQTFYLNGLAMGTGIALLMMYYFTGIAPANMPLPELLLHYSPLLVWRQIMIRWAQQFNARPKAESGMLWAGRFITMAALPVYLMALIGVIRNKRMTFKVTPKGEEWEMPVQPEGWSVFKPHVVIAAMLLVGMAFAGQLHHTDVVFFAWGMSMVTLMVAFSLIPGWIFQVRQLAGVIGRFTVQTTYAAGRSLARAIRSRRNVPHLPSVQPEPDPELAVE